MNGGRGAWRHGRHGGHGFALALWFVVCLAACSQAGPPPPAVHEPPPPAVDDLPRQPEAATERQTTTLASRRFEHEAVASAHPLASAAGLQMLQQGGSALDAAIAVQLVLALVEPQSSGIGGGAFLLHWDGHVLQAWDGRETAPASADERLFLDNAGQPLGFDDAVSSGLSVGVPGAVHMLEAAHREHGRLPWAKLFEPAITLAEQGFPVGARMAGLLRSADANWLKGDPQARGYFFHAGAGATLEPLGQGERLRNPAFAAVLRRLAAQGGAALHEGPIAADIVRRVRGNARHAGRLSGADLASYRPKQREPICTPWRRYRVCGFPPPSSGHLATMQILGLLDHLPAPPAPLEGGLPSAAFLHRYAEVARLAYADRARYVADPDFTSAPAGRWTSLLDEQYLASRAQLFNEQRSMGRAAPGEFVNARSSQFAPQQAQPEYGTSHISIVDRGGHAVSMTTTVEAAFGSRILSDGGTGLPGGFLLNNQLTDFAFAPRDAQGRFVANRVEPGKRPRSSMAPTMVFEAQAPRRLVMVVGSPGGATIIHYNAKVLLATLGWGLTPQDAVDLPNFANDNGATRLETGRFPLATRQALTARGQRVVEQDLTSGTQVLLRADEGGWWGGADSRREGVVLGD